LNKIAADAEIGSRVYYAIPMVMELSEVSGTKKYRGIFSGINFNIHTKGHLIRAAQEGIVFSFRYGLDIMQEYGAGN